MRFDRNSRLVRDLGVTVCSSIVVQDFKLHLKFEQIASALSIFKHFRLCSENFSIFRECQTTLPPCHVWMNQQLQSQVCHRNYLPTATSTTFESPMWMTLKGWRMPNPYFYVPKYPSSDALPAPQIFYKYLEYLLFWIGLLNSQFFAYKMKNCIGTWKRNTVFYV